MHTSDIPDTQRIKCVGFLDPEPLPVPACSPTAPRSDRQSQDTERVNECVPRRIHCRRVSKRLFGLCFDFRVSEFAGCLIALERVAVVATQCQIRHPVGATARTREEMIQFKGRVPAPAVGTAPLEFFQQIGSDFPSAQLAALVLDPSYLWILHER